MQHHLMLNLLGKGGVGMRLGMRFGLSSIVSQAQLAQVSLRLNQRPRKTLGFETPASKLQASVASTI
jgi:hypothetical protein